MFCACRKRKLETIYITKSLKYVRRNDLEGLNSNLAIIDLDGIVKSRLINIYRSFTPQSGDSQRENFQYQLILIKKALENCENCILLGDFNLNYAKKNNVGYKYENFFNDFDEVLFNMNLIQLIY